MEMQMLEIIKTFPRFDTRQNALELEILFFPESQHQWEQITPTFKKCVTHARTKLNVWIMPWKISSKMGFGVE
jgi:hypothetical protein